MVIDTEFILLVISTLSILVLMGNIIRKRPVSQLQNAFATVLITVLVISTGVILQLVCTSFFNVEPIYFENFIYIGTCMLPVALFFVAIIFRNTKIRFKRKYLLLFVIPFLTLLVLYTNKYHHLFYKTYSTNLSEMVYGSYFYIHSIYTYGLLLVSIGIMINASLKNSGSFSKQTILIIIGTMFPILVNLAGTFKIWNMNVCLTPISFSIAVIFYTFAILKFNFLKITPIALQKIVDRISDGYVVLDEENTITDFNKTFLDMFNLKPENIRSKNFIRFLNNRKVSKKSIVRITKSIQKANETDETISFEQHFSEIKKYFKIEITPIKSDNNSLGILFLLKDITQHKEDMETIKNNQDILMERERLAGLGQLIGGIAHNLKTPIMSIAGAVQGLENLIREYDESIDDPLVNSQDHHDIAKDMEEWIPKIRAHLEYMSDIITTVKGQAVASLSSDDTEEFTINELIKRVNILMKHELKNAYIYMNVVMKTDENQVIKGNVNSLVQVVNNMISNAIQAYEGKHDQNIEMIVNKKENNIVISITDFAGGLPKEVQDRLFKEMVTTKGKNGTGLGLYMSYSNIKAHFGGDITYVTETGKGTTFNIIIPLR
ncbi:integral membrane sensor signal transduction histidine kinase [Clostridium sp. CAG:356]|nr:integral membrane sensor signal transduction histidine kinase [Clostridium sp. CAG:356]